VGFAMDDKQAYFPLTRGGKGAGLTAVNLESEKSHGAGSPASDSAPVTVIPGVVFEGSSNGRGLCIFDRDGKALWQYDTNNHSRPSTESKPRAEASGRRRTGCRWRNAFCRIRIADLFGGPRAAMCCWFSDWNRARKTRLGVADSLKPQCAKAHA